MSDFTTSGLNSLKFREELSNELDKALVQKSVVTGFLDNGFASKFVGTKTVLLPDVSFVGLGDYDRAEGFPEGGITVDHKPYTLTQERARRFYFDREDMDEVGIAGLSGQIMGEFVRTKVAPEMDAYCLSKLAGIADNDETKRHNVVSLAANKTMADGCVGVLSEAIKQVQNIVGFDEELIALCGSDFYGALMSTPELTRRLDVGDFKKGEISTKVRKLDECWIKPVPMSRMKTAYTFNDGVTDGQKDGGFVAKKVEGKNENIGCIVLPKKVAKLVKKLEKTRIFSPEQCQKKDAWQFDYRLYYDMLVNNSELDSIWIFTY